jgi:hypothetical protein
MPEAFKELRLIAAANEVPVGLLPLTRWRIFHLLLAVLAVVSP